MMPRQPGQPAAVGTQGRCGVEIIVLDQHMLLATVKRDSDQQIDCFAIAGAVILTHADQPAAIRVDDEVGIAQRGFGGDGFRGFARPLPVNALVGEVGEVDDAVADGVIAAAVLVDARAGIEAGRGHVLAPAHLRPTDNDVAAAFLRAALNPVDVVAVGAGLRQADCAAKQQVGGDGGFPGTVGSDRRRRHNQ